MRLLEAQGLTAIPHDGTKLVNVDHDDEVNDVIAPACLFSCVVLFHIS